MSKTNYIINNKTLETYNKKYKNLNYRLLRVTKKEVEDFDKKYNTKNGYLLQGRKWWFIKDTYYEIPKAPGITWFRNLHAAVQVGTCVLAAGVVASAITVPIVLLNKTNKPEIEVTNIDEVILDNKGYDNEGNAIFNIKAKDDKKISSIEISIDTYKLIEKTDYTFDKESGDTKIYKKTLDEHKGKIVVKANISPSVDSITLNKETVTIGDKGKIYQLKAKTKPEGIPVTWSSNSNIIKVINDGTDKAGTVYTDETYVGSTEATITATAGNVQAQCKVTCEEMYNIDWTTTKHESGRSLYEMCQLNGGELPGEDERHIFKVVVGKNTKYQDTVDALLDKTEYDASDIKTTAAKSIKAYVGKNPTTNKREMYLLADKKISFEDDDTNSGGGMFNSCSANQIILENIDTSSITSFANTFGRTNVSSLDVSNMNTQNGTDFYEMFSQNQGKGSGASDNLVYINGLDKFDTSNVKNYNSMFWGAQNLKYLNLSSFDTKNATDMAIMFKGCKSLQTIITSNSFDVSKTLKEGDRGEDMFKECVSLKGSSNTSCDGENDIDASRAKIDGGVGDEGYFYNINLKKWYHELDWYKHINDVEITNEDIGITTYVLIDGLYYETRLIGIGHDILADGSKKAKTTWEFENCINKKDLYNSNTLKWDETDNKKFTSSVLNDFLNDSTTGFINKFPKDFKDVIKKVTKEVGMDNNYTKKQYDTFLFPLSVYELGFKLDNHDFGFGTPYSYYVNETLIKSELRVKRCLYSYSTNDNTAWTRSPSDVDQDSNPSDQYSYSCDIEGKITLMPIILDNKINVAPAFCI